MVFIYSRRFAGEPASGAPGPIPDDYVAWWLREMHGRREFPVRWGRALVAAWRADFRGDWRRKIGVAPGANKGQAVVARARDL